MAVANKTRRKITVNGRPYIWCVRTDGEYSGVGSVSVLQIIAGDKTLIVSYPINQTGTHNLIAFQFLQVGTRTIADGIYRHVECPRWETDKPITPGIVRSIIVWCLQDRQYVHLDYLGELEAPAAKTGHLRLVVSN